MIELPEAVVIARQIGEELAGKRIESGVRGNAPHKFAFYSRPAEEYAVLLRGKTVGEARAHGSLIVVGLEPDHLLALGCGGERIVYHRSAATLPAKHQLLLQFTDGTYLSVTVQGWGAALLLPRSEAAGHPLVGPPRISPLDDAFTYEHFAGLFAGLPPGDPCFVKAFVISKPGVWGVGNGCLQDILFQARIHPRRRALDLAECERRALYDSTREMLARAVALGGRASERDLHDRPGGYRRILDSGSVDTPCPRCGIPIQKIQFLGGSSYFCPACQVASPGGVV